MSTRNWPAYLRIPPFLAVPIRTRADGWTPLRQAEFIGLLAETGSVRTAAASIGVSRESAYRLRSKRGAGSFIAAWNTAASARPHPLWKFTPEERWRIAEEGLWHVRLRRSRYAGAAQKPSTSALLRLIAAYDRSLREADLAELAWLAEPPCQPAHLARKASPSLIE